MGTRTALVVLPDDEAQASAAAVLKSLGLGVVRARDATTALLVSESLKLELVVLGDRSPGMEGTALLRALRGLSPQLPLIFLASEPELHSESTAADAGAHGYLPGPLDPSALERAVRSVL